MQSSSYLKRFHPINRISKTVSSINKLINFLKNIHTFNEILGHSLGSHLSSYIGKSIYAITGKKVGRITALDPAGPGWENKQMNETERLNSNDADFVDVIHTDIFYSGYVAPIGHVDFYPNDGKHQPGCPPKHVDSKLIILLSMTFQVSDSSFSYLGKS